MPFGESCTAPEKLLPVYSKGLMKRQSKLTPREEQSLSNQLGQQQAAHEFPSVEEMLRHDALHTPVPPTIAGRLQKSLRGVPSSKPGWLRRFFGS
jgi:hypothetical protein